jgi:hypothetical protein
MAVGSNIQFDAILLHNSLTLYKIHRFLRSARVALSSPISMVEAMKS